MQDLLLALALLLVIEGLLPAVSPGGFRRTMQKMTEVEDKHLRILGLFSMITGAVLLYFFR